MYLLHILLKLFPFLYCEIMRPKIGWFDAGMSKPADAIPYGEKHVECLPLHFRSVHSSFTDFPHDCESFKPFHPWGFAPE